MIVRIRRNTNSLEVMRHTSVTPIMVVRFSGLMFSSIVDTDMKRLPAPISGPGCKDRVFESIKRIDSVFYLLYVCVTNY